MPQRETTQKLMAAFAHYVSYHNDAKQHEMLDAIEKGEDIYFGFGRKIHYNEYKHHIAVVHAPIVKKTVSRIKCKKSSLPKQPSQESLQKVATLSVLIEMGGGKEKCEQIKNILQSDHHQMRLSHVIVNGKIVTAKAHLYIVKCQNSEPKFSSHIRPAHWIDNSHQIMQGFKKYSGASRKNQCQKSHINKSPVFFQSIEGKDKDPP